jgi:hypothetical protein
MSKEWYFFMGDDPLDAKNYYHVNAHNCLCGNRICSIYLYYTGRQPTAPLSANMQQYINDALATGQLQPAKPYYAKKYVYLREI